MTTLETCPGCGARFPASDGPVHAYMTSSPGCWAAFGQVLAAEYSDVRLAAIHRLSVDAYAVQHPGDGSRSAIQSVGLHLARLMLELETPLAPARANDMMRRMAAHKASLVELDPPARFTVTVADVAPHAGTAGHADAVKRWAASAFADWRAHHAYIRAWAKEALG